MGGFTREGSWLDYSHQLPNYTHGLFVFLVFVDIVVVVVDVVVVVHGFYLRLFQMEDVYAICTAGQEKAGEVSLSLSSLLLFICPFLILPLSLF